MNHRDASRWRWALPLIIVTLLATSVAVVALRAARAPRTADAAALRVEELKALRGRILVYRLRDDGADDKRMAALPLSEHGARRIAFGPRCERVASSARHLVCLGRSRDPLRPYQATLFDHEFKTIGETPLNGSPSRTRISPDEKHFATTSFVAGDSYADDIFSTRTFVHGIGAEGLEPGAAENVEYYDLVVNSEVYRYPDKNVWGVTFVAGQDRFFATASMSGHRYLVDANMRERKMVAVRDNVECPSLSPNGLRIAYKKRVRDGQIVAWRFHVLDLISGEERALGEERSIDDQIAWLDDDTVLYGAPRADGKGADVWSASIKGGAPVLFVAGGDSPTVIENW